MIRHSAHLWPRVGGLLVSQEGCSPAGCSLGLPDGWTRLLACGCASLVGLALAWGPALAVSHPWPSSQPLCNTRELLSQVQSQKSCAMRRASFMLLMTHDSMTLLLTKGVNIHEPPRCTAIYNESAQFSFTQDGQDSTRRFSSTKGILFLHSYCSGMLVSVVARAEETRHRAKS
jgi:hypothetical protein